jgi:hypothetical protein
LNIGCHMLERKFTKIGGQLVNGPKSEFRSPVGTSTPVKKMVTS